MTAVIPSFPEDMTAVIPSFPEDMTAVTVFHVGRMLD